MARRSTAGKTSPRPPGRVAFDRLHIWQIQAIRDLLWVTAALGLVWFGYAMRAVTIPLLIALLLAYLFEPVVAKLSANRRLNRPVIVSTLLMKLGYVLLLWNSASIVWVRQRVRGLEESPARADQD